MTGCERLQEELESLGARRVWWADRDAFVRGDTDALEQELVTADEAARRDRARVSPDRFGSLPFAAADAAFGRHRRYEAAARSAIRPFARFFGRLSIEAFLAFDADNSFRLVFGRDPQPSKSATVLAPEGRMRTLRGICAVLRDAGLTTPAAVRDVCAEDESQAYADLRRALDGVFGVGDATVDQLRRNVGVPKPELTAVVRRWIAVRIGLSTTATAAAIERALAAAAADLGRDPFEVDRLVWHAMACDARLPIAPPTGVR